MPEIKLYYFDFPGRGEATRLILTYGGVTFEDVRVTREDWPALKLQTPFGQIPAMTIDGAWLAQSFAIEQYAGNLANLVPADPFEHATALQAVYLMEEAFQLFTPTYKMDTEAKVAARKELLAGGAFGAKLQMFNKLLDGKQFILGGELCWVDLSIFCGMSLVRAGWLDGIGGDYMDSYPALKAFHARVAKLPKVQQYYAGRTGLYLGHQVEEP